MAKWSSQHNGKYPDPYSKLKFNDDKKKEKKKKKNKNRDREHNRENKILSQIDSNANKVRTTLHLIKITCFQLLTEIGKYHWKSC